MELVKQAVVAAPMTAFHHFNTTKASSATRSRPVARVGRIR